jgi:hypothetical protein
MNQDGAEGADERARAGHRIDRDRLGAGGPGVQGPV